MKFGLVEVDPADPASGSRAPAPHFIVRSSVLTDSIRSSQRSSGSGFNARAFRQRNLSFIPLLHKVLDLGNSAKAKHLLRGTNRLIHINRFDRLLNIWDTLWSKA